MIAGSGKVSLGSDLSGLEDRVKHHFMIPHDPEYVATMMEDNYDPHIYMAYGSGLISEKQYLDFKNGIKDEFVVDARRKGKTLNYSCLPVDNTEVLTDKGWKMWHEITLDDKVLSLNTETHTTEFCDINGTVFFEDRPVIEMSTHSWKVESTPDHRWYVDQRTGRGRTRRHIFEYRTTETLTTASRIVSSAKYVGGGSSVSRDDAALVAWILADGYFKVSEFTKTTSQGLEGQRQGVLCSVSQSSKKYLKELRDVVRKSGLKFVEDMRDDGVHTFRFASSSIRDFWKRVGLPLVSKHEIDYTQWMLSLSQEALEGFFEAFHLADGLTNELSKKYKTITIYQRPGKISDAVQLCGELLGRNTYNNLCSDGMNLISSRETGFLGMQNTKKEVTRSTDVFCLTTKNGNFVIRQNGFITITGNCVYGAGGAKVASTLGVSEQEGKDLVEGYWKVNWSVEAIAKDQVVVECQRGLKWLINPVNGLLYNIRSEKDIFSTLAQGTGAFMFDNWVDRILAKMDNKWGVVSLTYQAHDELVIVCRDKQPIKKVLEDMIRESIEEVSEKFLLRRKLGCDCQFGQRYSEIH